MRLSFREKFSSRVDYPQLGLPADLWEIIDGEFQLKPNIASAIENMATAILEPVFRDIDKWVVTYLLGSSIATQFWKEDSDIDVKVVVDLDEFRKRNPEYARDTDLQLKEIFLEKVFDKHKNKEYFKISNRPLDMYLASDKDIYTKDYQKRFDALYDVISKRWIKNPKLYNIDEYDREEVVEEGEALAIKWAEKWDLDLGKIRRKIKETELIKQYIKKLDKVHSARFKQKIENLMFALKQDIEKMHTEKNFVKQEYYQAYDNFNPDIEKYYDSVNALPEVIRMKLLNLWGYIYIIKQLNDLIKDDSNIGSKDVEKVKKVLNDQIP